MPGTAGMVGQSLFINWGTDTTYHTNAECLGRADLLRFLGIYCSVSLKPAKNFPLCCGTWEFNLHLVALAWAKGQQHSKASKYLCSSTPQKDRIRKKPYRKDRASVGYIEEQVY